MELREAFGQAVRQVRKEMGVQQEAVGPSQSYISDVERGLKSPSLVKIEDIAAALGVDVLTLVARAVLIQHPGMDKQDLLTKLRNDLEMC
ncbi:helix-turn-helix domain-containing protein [Stutzerimonas kunmingensis]|uniref:helix-turn-helix domain-containing protein n=1 Tax=Stutzerimonas kunmingensis TaxID=1211807 RepID=UPI00241F021A|nr:helix-turn-helix transcriptional regulator [Stutzerimonas kunmingensis]